MNSIRLLSLSLLLCLAACAGPSKSFTLTDTVIRIPRTDAPIIIDGRLNDPVWSVAPTLPINRWVYEESTPEPATVQLTWDDVCLYFAAHVTDSHRLATLTQRDDKIFSEDCIELFIDPRGDAQVYYELQISPRAVFWDSIVLAEKERRSLSDNLWNAPSLKVATADTPDGWTLEGRVHFADLKRANHVPPHHNDVWRINVYRVNAVEHGPLTYASWAPTEDFHDPSRFGRLIFDDKARHDRLLAARARARQWLTRTAQPGVNTLAERIGTMTVDTPTGRTLRFRTDDQSWRPVDRGHGRFEIDDSQRKTIRAHPVSGNEPLRGTWSIKQTPARLVVIAKLSPGGERNVNIGRADGVIVRVMRNDRELDYLIVRDATPQAMVLDIKEPGDLTLIIDPGPAGNARSDSVFLNVFEK